jgi:hypothetical protein
MVWDGSLGRRDEGDLISRATTPPATPHDPVQLCSAQPTADPYWDRGSWSSHGGALSANQQHQLRTRQGRGLEVGRRSYVLELAPHSAAGLARTRGPRVSRTEQHDLGVITRAST